MPTKQFSLWRQILLKHLTDSAKCHTIANKITTRVTLNKKNFLFLYNFFFLLLRVIFVVILLVLT
jgi:hypothetical protein